MHAHTRHAAWYTRESTRKLSSPSFTQRLPEPPPASRSPNPASMHSPIPFSPCANSFLSAFVAACCVASPWDHGQRPRSSSLLCKRTQGGQRRGNGATEMHPRTPFARKSRSGGERRGTHPAENRPGPRAERCAGPRPALPFSCSPLTSPW